MWAPSRSVIWLSLIATVLALIPFVSSGYVLIILTFANIYAITAASWDLLAGYAGQVSFGHVAFYGIGAYAVGLLSKYFGHHPEGSWMSNPLFGVLAGIVAAVTLSLVIGLVAVRLRGPYLTLVTFMVATVLQQLVVIEGDITGGQFGLTPGSLFNDARLTYWASLLLMVTSVAVMILVTKSRYGLCFKCIRDDEIAAQAIGINPTKYKLYAFALSAALCSIAGSFYVLAAGIVNYDLLGYNSNLLWIEMSVIGGSGTILGSVFGSYFLMTLSEALRLQPGISLVAFAAAFVVIVRFFPWGLLALLRRIGARVW